MDYGAYIQAIMSMAGMAIEAGERQKAQRLLDAARERFEGILPPELKDLQEQLGPSALEDVRPDAQADAAQRDALRRALVMAAEGFTAEDDAALTETSNRTNAAARAQREGIAASMAQRGGTGSGADYALQAEAADMAALRASEAQKRIQAEGLRRRAEGTRTAGAMASALRGQVGAEDARRAEATDRIRAQNNAIRRSGAQANFDNRMARARGIAGATSESTAAGIANGRYTGGAIEGAGAFAHAASHQPQPYQEPPSSGRALSAPPLVQADDEFEPWDPRWSNRG